MNQEERLRRRIGRLEMMRQQRQQVSDRLAQVRLVWFLAGVVVAALVFVRWGAGPWAWVMAVVLVPFVVLVALHRRVETAVIRLTIWLDIQRTHLARLSLDWAALPPPLAEPIPPDHPFALDLDLVGERSLHRLLDTAVSVEGSRQLRDWLLATTPDIPAMTRRQKLVAELARLPLFRDKLVLQARLVAAAGEGRYPGAALLRWLNQQQLDSNLRGTAWLLSALAVVNIVIGLLWSAGQLPDWALVFMLPYLAIYAAQWGKVGDLFGDVVKLDDGLRRLDGVFALIEGWRYGRTPHLQVLCQPFLTGEMRPSVQVRRLHRVVAFIGVRQNPLLALAINLVVPWDMLAGVALAARKAELQRHLPQWLAVWYELEALAALGGFAAQHPAHVFPEVDAGLEVVFAANGLGHPLIGSSQKVRNDFAVSELGAVALITGSNMAGKSTFLRTVGVNLALAFAGSVVDAAGLTTRPLRLFSSIRVADSVTDGFSFFYAEVRRLQQLLTELRQETAVPLFYFIDEIFRGTNNRERLLGSREYIRAVAGGNGVGLVATHDLELVKLADEMTAVSNYHFRDDVADGKMVFDYKLWPGPCPTTNALKIMAQAGLPVPD